MPVGTTLGELVADLRAELGASASPAQGASLLATWKHLLKRTQDRLYNDFDWPHLIVERDEALAAGQRYYTFDDTLDFSRIFAAHVKDSEQWQPIKEGFNTELYNAEDSDEDVRSDPVRAWRHYETNQFEVWPVPLSAQTLRFRGVKKLGPLISNSDTAELDDHLIVLFTAARLLKKSKSEDADNVLAEANTHFQRLKANSIKSAPFIMGGGTPSTRHDREIRVRPI